jgi:hypothetical protein
MNTLRQDRCYSLGPNRVPPEQEPNVNANRVHSVLRHSYIEFRSYNRSILKDARLNTPLCSTSQGQLPTNAADTGVASQRCRHFFLFCKPHFTDSQRTGNNRTKCSFPKIFLAYFPYLEKDKSRIMLYPCCLCVCVYPPVNIPMPEPDFMKADMYSYIMTPEPSQQRTS